MFVVLDPGHGGAGPGGGSNTLWKEKDLNLKISLYEKKRLEQLGIPVVITRSNDVLLSPTERVNIVNSYTINTNDAIVVSNHINNGGGKGAEVIYSVRSTPILGNYVADELRKTGQNIRSVYKRTNTLGSDYYFILRDTPYSNSILVEYGFADNAVDQEILFYNWPVLAEAVVRAIANYYNVVYIPPNFSVYIVRKNDSLYNIARNYNTTIDKIKEANNLSTNNLYPGQELFIYS